MSFLKEENIGKVSFFASVILVILLTTVLGIVFFQDKYSQFKKNLQRVESTYLTLQKNHLKSDVNVEIDHINGQRKNSEQRLKTYIQQKVTESHAMAANIYKNNISLGPNQVKAFIIDTLRPVSFNNGREYLFIWDATDGSLVLYPPEPSSEGVKDYLHVHEHGQPIYLKMKQIALDEGEGFIQYQWANPRESKTVLFPKITYVKYFKPFNWVIGTGEYLDSFEQDLQKSIINNLNNEIPESDSPEYLFIYKLHEVNGGDDFATMLVNPNAPDLVGTKISDNYKDAKGFMFRREMLKGIQDKGEAFVPYWYEKPGSKGVFAKLSYFKYYPEWQWIVAKGIYLNDLEGRIAEMQLELHQEIIKKIWFLVSFLSITCVFFLGLAYLFSRGVSVLFEGYKKTQNEHRRKLVQLNKILEIQATTDSLTKTYNRGYFNTRLEQELSRANRYHGRPSVILFDIDKFKLINDSFGHLSGDKVLIDLANLCLENIRSSDVFARWGGEEFTILMPECTNDTATLFAEKLRLLIEEHPFSIPSTVTCSFGVANYIQEENVDDFINRADKALYASKQSGRNRVTAL